MKQEIKESIRNEYVHGYLNEAGQRNILDVKISLHLPVTATSVENSLFVD